MKYSKPVILVSPMGNARERFEAFKRGEPMPERTGRRAELSNGEIETFRDIFAAAMAKLYLRQKEDGII